MNPVRQFLMSYAVTIKAKGKSIAMSNTITLISLFLLSFLIITLFVVININHNHPKTTSMQNNTTAPAASSPASFFTLIKETLNRAKACPVSQSLICPVSKNVITGRNSTGTNTLSQSLYTNLMGYPTNVWITKNQIAAHGGTLKNGEHPIFINQASPGFNNNKTQPVFCTLSAQAFDNPGEKINYTRVQAFNVHQVDGLPKSFYGKQSNQHSQTPEAVESILLASGLSISNGGAKALQELIKSVCKQVEIPGQYSNPENNLALTELVAALGACFLTSRLTDTFSLVLNKRLIDDWLFLIQLDEKILFRVIAEAWRSANALLAKLDVFKRGTPAQTITKLKLKNMEKDDSGKITLRRRPLVYIKPKPRFKSNPQEYLVVDEAMPFYRERNVNADLMRLAAKRLRLASVERATDIEKLGDWCPGALKTATEDFDPKALLPYCHQVQVNKVFLPHKNETAKI